MLIWLRCTILVRELLLFTSVSIIGFVVISFTSSSLTWRSVSKIPQFLLSSKIRWILPFAFMNAFTIYCGGILTQKHITVSFYLKLLIYRHLVMLLCIHISLLLLRWVFHIDPINLIVVFVDYLILIWRILKLKIIKCIKFDLIEFLNLLINQIFKFILILSILILFF